MCLGVVQYAFLEVISECHSLMCNQTVYGMVNFKQMVTSILKTPL